MRWVLPFLLAFLIVGCGQPAASSSPDPTAGPALRHVFGLDCRAPAPGDPVPDCMRSDR